jgi:polysaccharide deacetylase family protein (PEP-CTERM system associated)
MVVAVRDESVRLPAGALLLSVDFEDWHQLVRRRVGDPAWREPGPALARETEALLQSFDRLGVRGTFFFLGMAARAHPHLVRLITDAGHEVACHGDQHRPVQSQTPEEFGQDLRAARATIEDLTGVAPVGYRAPAFSMSPRTEWAVRVLEAEGFAYDASQCESPRRSAGVPPSDGGPYPVPNTRLWEFPVAVWRSRSIRFPVGGASYWTVTPTPVVLQGLTHLPDGAGLYLHPCEFDPQPLQPGLTGGLGMGARGRARLRTAQRNASRRRAPGVLSAIADRFSLMTYGEAHARLTAGVGSRP